MNGLCFEPKEKPHQVCGLTGRVVGMPDYDTPILAHLGETVIILETNPALGERLARFGSDQCGELLFAALLQARRRIA